MSRPGSSTVQFVSAEAYAAYLERNDRERSARSAAEAERADLEFRHRGVSLSRAPSYYEARRRGAGR